MKLILVHILILEIFFSIVALGADNFINEDFIVVHGLKQTDFCGIWFGYNYETAILSKSLSKDGNLDNNSLAAITDQLKNQCYFPNGDCDTLRAHDFSSDPQTIDLKMAEGREIIHFEIKKKGEYTEITKHVIPPSHDDPPTFDKLKYVNGKCYPWFSSEKRVRPESDVVQLDLQKCIDGKASEKAYCKSNVWWQAFSAENSNALVTTKTKQDPPPTK